MKSLQQMMCTADGYFQPPFAPPYSGPLQYPPTLYHDS